MAPTYCVCLELRSLPSAGVTRLQRYYEPLRQPKPVPRELPGNSDINLFRYCQGVIDHDAHSAYVLSNRGKASTLPRFGERQKNDRLNIDGHRKTPDRECGVDIQQAARFGRCFLKPVKP
jgi:hypothetical protein